MGRLINKQTQQSAKPRTSKTIPLEKQRNNTKTLKTTNTKQKPMQNGRGRKWRMKCRRILWRVGREIDIEKTTNTRNTIRTRGPPHRIKQ